MKDGPEGAEIYSRLEIVEVGVDEDGEPITSCVIVPADKNTTSERTKVSGQAKVALDLLHRAIADAGEIPPASNHIGAPCSKVRVGERWLSPFRAGGGDMPPRGTAPRLHGEVGQPDRRDPGRQRLLPSRRNLRLEDPPTTCVSECS